MFGRLYGLFGSLHSKCGLLYSWVWLIPRYFLMGRNYNKCIVFQTQSMIKSFAAIAAAAALLTGGIANAAEVGARWSNGGYTRNTYNGHETRSSRDHGSYRTDFSESQLDVSASSSGGRRSGRTSSGALTIGGYTAEGYRSGNYDNSSTSRNDFSGHEWGNFGENSTFTR